VRPGHDGRAALAGEAPVTGDLSDGFDVQAFPAREELAILGRDSMARYGTALFRLALRPLETRSRTWSRMRYLLHPSGVETAAVICSLVDISSSGGDLTVADRS